jgi:hypothetical protein
MMVRRRLLTLAVAIALLGLGPVAAFAQAKISKPSGPVILSVKGDIGQSNTDKGGMNCVQFDRAMLERLPQSSLETNTPWTEGLQRFEGIRLVELLRLLEAGGKEITISALNDYSVTMNLQRYAPFGPLLAMRHDGEPMRIADKGPIWLVFPQDDFPELDQAQVHDLWVWQIQEILVE